VSRVVWLDGAYPALSGDITRNLRKGSRALAAARLRARVRFDHPAAYQAEITRAWEARCAQAGRDADRQEWRGVWAQATELATLRIGGQLAAWALGRATPPAYAVLAGQMVPGFERYRPGRLLEAALLGRVLTDPACCLVDWGEGHPEALLTAR
jgi:hypothetical protein